MSKQSYLTEDIKKVIKEFQKAVDKAKEKFEGSGIFADFSKRKPGQGQYSGVIFWYKWAFSSDIIDKLKERNIDIKGINIMPYRITKAVVEKAANKDADNAKKFNEEIIPNPEYCDYDPKSGNFHMKPNGQYQVVLVGGLGPGWKGGKSIIESENIDDRLKKIKVEHYFPRIDSEDNTESIAKLVENALQALADILGPGNVLSERLKNINK